MSPDCLAGPEETHHGNEVTALQGAGARVLARLPEAPRQCVLIHAHVRNGHRPTPTRLVKEFAADG